MPRKVFTAGEVLAAADVNEFLGDQAIMTFAGTAARGSAISSPTEGMMTYMNDTDQIDVWSGSAWVRRVSTSLPFAMSIGSVNVTTTTTQTVTFPSGRFTVAPRITTGTYNNDVNTPASPILFNVSTTGFSFQAFTIGGAFRLGVVDYTAIQMTSASAEG